MEEVRIVGEQGGKTRVKNPFNKWKVMRATGVDVKEAQGFLELSFAKGGEIILGEAGW